MHRRQGVSLIEALVVMATMSVITTLAATTIVLMMRAEGSGTKSVAASITLSRLATDFRRDVRAAESFEISDEKPAELKLQLAGQDVTYKAEAHTLVRAVTTDGETKSSETYVLAAGEARFETIGNHNSGEAPLIALVHRRLLAQKSGNKGADAPTREYRIVAGLGIDQRFRKTQK